MKKILELKKELKSLTNKEGQITSQRFFKEKVNTYGMKSKDIGLISKKYYEYVKELPKKELYEICEELFRSDMYEEFMIAADWIYRRKDTFTLKDFAIFEKWIDKYVNNWAKCDVFCNHSVGSLIEKYPGLVSKLKIWAKSKNLWLRRASAVSLITPVRNGMFLKETFEISNILLHDKEDMVQKGYGWLLKVASDKHLKEVFDYVILHKATMPRTSLRYAIEKMPKNMKSKAMKK